jgi:LPXTG-motif cell wall-anchored protein
MAFEDMDNNDVENGEFEDDAPPEESGNRLFFIIAGAIGLVALLLLGCIIIFVLSRLSDRPSVTEQATTVAAQNTQMAFVLTQTSDALMAPTFTATPTRTNTAVPNTPTVQATSTPTRTSVVVAAPTETPGTATGPDPAQAALTSTVAALQTRAAQITQTVIPTATSLPQTGFADDVGLPTMLGAAALLAVVIILARRLRTA